MTSRIIIEPAKWIRINHDVSIEDFIYDNVYCQTYPFRVLCKWANKLPV